MKPHIITWSRIQSHLLVCLIVLLSSLPVLAEGVSEVSTSENPQILVDTDWLADRLEAPGLIIVDFRKSRRAYLCQHIPGAIYLTRDAVLSRVDGIPNMMPPFDDLVRRLEQTGISNQMTVVVYDEHDGLWASRLFWTLEYLGHPDVRLLNGGWSKWKRERWKTSPGDEQAGIANFQPQLQSDRLAHKEWLLQHLSADGVIVVDVRSPREYRGVDVRAMRGGHVPEAANIEWERAVTPGQIKVLRSQAELDRIYGVLSLDRAEEIVTYCQSGIRASHTYFTLRYLGYKNVRVYDGSWAEWGNDLSTPIDK